MSGQRYLITGGSGLLGNGVRRAVEMALGEKIVARDFFFASSADANLSDMAECRALFLKCKPTHLVHLAARVGGLFANMEDNIGFFRDNMRINDNVLQCAHEFHVGRAVFCLSTCVFPSDAPLPLTEDSLHAGPPHFSNEGYATSKRVLEMLVRFYRQRYNYEWFCVIPTNLYGPHDNFDLQDAHVIPSLIHKCYLAKKQGTPFEVFGSGKPVRQFLHSEDAGRAIWKLLSTPSENLGNDHLFILAGDVGTSERTIAQTAEIIAKVMELDTPVKFDTTKADGIFRKPASNARLRNAIGDSFLSAPLEESLAATVRWFVEFYDSGIDKPQHPECL
eukprot:GHVT01064746.1.p1 GENE.GHVT01064746.1~~GHVT01064746.1.p1  ORF type:complete len:334 (+),score=35.55 GHVT01064746.1:150-1151(+)